MRALEFLAARLPRRAARAGEWGVGTEDLALFHETSGEEERQECAAALAWQRERWAAGFGWLTGPLAHGGAGLPAGYDRLYRQLEDRFEVPDMNPLRIGLGTVGPAIAAYGTPEQVDRFAVGLYRGERVACQLFSEPDAGSDLAGVRTRAVREGADWVITGQKVWTSNATFADLGLALVRTDPDAPKHRGLTMFVVPMDAPGVRVVPLRQLTGGTSFTEVFLTDVRVSDEHRIGAPGEGWRVATGALAGERRAVGDRWHERNARALELLRGLAERTGRWEDPLARQEWARLYSRLRIARFQQERMQQVALGGAERAVDKLLLSTNLRLVGELAAELAGPAFTADTGEWGHYGWNRWLMGALGYRIAGGTEEILKTMLAERVLGLPKEPR
ncbi:acyl-CoA dehydrogenase [Pseudonocardia eucalypti]|uniref:acyl-CoA dehydrogenase family protein n=1 Tax=Pseudonocardia eucalypti TaxID=648755 RepID=UPI0017E38A79|nr:acyl-CoA dehydrogenase [Pseudonocardia eucalypti]